MIILCLHFQDLLTYLYLRSWPRSCLQYIALGKVFTRESRRVKDLVRGAAHDKQDEGVNLVESKKKIIKHNVFV
jgi:hypothetical protein